MDPDKDVTVFQIGNSGARMAAILSGTVDGTIMAADFVPKAKREGFNILADLADTKIEYRFLSLNMMGNYIDCNPKLVKALIKSMSEAIRALQTDQTATKTAIRAALKTDDAETVDYALVRSVAVLAAGRFPPTAEFKPCLTSSARSIRTSKFEDFVDMRALHELEREGVFK